jgi:hypothetical protein
MEPVTAFLVFMAMTAAEVSLCFPLASISSRMTSDVCFSYHFSWNFSNILLLSQEDIIPVIDTIWIHCSVIDYRNTMPEMIMKIV